MSTEPARTSGWKRDAGFPSGCSPWTSWEAAFPPPISHPFSGVEIHIFEDMWRTFRNITMRAGDVSPLVESMSVMHEAYIPFPAFCGVGVLAHSSNPWGRGRRIKVILHQEFRAIWGPIRPTDKQTNEQASNNNRKPFRKQKRHFHGPLTDDRIAPSNLRDALVRSVMKMMMLFP